MSLLQSRTPSDGSPLQAGLIKGKPMTEDVPVETFTGLYTESEMNNIKYQSNVMF